MALSVEEDGHAWWAGHKPEFMLSFRLKGGNEVVYSYGDFRGAMFRAGKSLILYFDTATITIIGKELGKLLSRAAPALCAACPSRARGCNV